MTEVPWRKQVVTIPVSPEVLRDFITTESLSRALERQMDRWAHPWRYPDPPAIGWTFDPFPRITTAQGWYRSVRAWRTHLAGWVGDLAYKIDPEHEQWSSEW